MAEKSITFATVPRLWPGETCVLIGGGPSLTSADVDAVRGRARVIAINDAYRLAPWAEVLYACDRKWWDWHQGVPSFAGLKYSLIDTKYPDVQILNNTGPYGLELVDRSGVRTGRNSGYQALNLAIHFGATRILLLGFDCGLGEGGESHWFGDHPVPQQSPYPHFRLAFEMLGEPLKAAGVTVLNCSRRTTLKCFQKVSLVEALQQVAA